VIEVLVIGASGFVGKRLALGLLNAGRQVRGLARTLEKVQDLAKAGGEVVKGDITDLESMKSALRSAEAAYICTHSLSRQATDSSKGYMDVELLGLENIVVACKANGVRRLIYVTSLGVSPESPCEWLRERWKGEQYLLSSGLDVTIIRPGQIVGRAGRSFDMMVGQARKRLALVLGGGRVRMQGIAIDDLVYYLIGVLEQPRAVGHCFDVSCDEVLTIDEIIDVISDVLKMPRPMKLHIPLALLAAVAPITERVRRLPKGAVRGALDGLKTDFTGDPMPIRELLPKRLCSYRQAVEQALIGKKDDHG
jgi:uncharacterized protein YbjT (DUF2867 family)